jgi:hypothetical protein
MLLLLDILKIISVQSIASSLNVITSVSMLFIRYVSD